MGKKKKNRVVKLSETEYGNYIMSLKEERPVEVIIPKNDPLRKDSD